MLTHPKGSDHPVILFLTASNRGLRNVYFVVVLVGVISSNKLEMA